MHVPHPIVKRPRKSFWVPAEVKDLRAYLESKGIEIVEGFKVLARRWVVERKLCLDMPLHEDEQGL